MTDLHIRSKVSTLGVIVIAMVSLLFLGGCKEAKPEDAIAKFFDFLHAGDSGSAQTLCTDRALNQMDGTVNVFNRIRDEHKSGDNIYAIDRLVSDIRGNTAEVWSRDDESLRVVLIRNDGKWKIDEFKTVVVENNGTRDNAGNRDNNNEDNAADNNDEAPANNRGRVRNPNDPGNNNDDEGD